MKTTLGRRWLSAFLALMMCLSLAPVSWAADTMTLTPGTGTLYVGGTPNETDITVSIAGIDTVSADDITWESDNGGIATVDKGKVTAVGAGTATITAKYSKDGTNYEGSCNIEVKDREVTSISVTVSALSLKAGDKGTPIYTVSGAYNDGTTEDLKGKAVLTWSLSSSSAAAINPSTGEITATAKGTADVTLKAEYDGKDGTGTGKLTVTAGDPTALAVTVSSTQSVEEGKSVTLTATVTPTPADADTSGLTYEWKSSNTGVATLTGSTTRTVTVKGEKPGTTNVTVTVKKGNVTSAPASCAVTVTERPEEMEGISLSPNGSIILDPGRYQEVKATAKPSTAPIDWSTSDSKVVTVQQTKGSTNNIYANGPGEAEITASITGGGENNTKKATLSVKVSGLVLEEKDKSMRLQENETKPLPIPLRYGNAETGRVVWQSSNPNVAQISGVNIAGRGPGRATITGSVNGNYEVSFTVEVEADEAVTIELRDPIRAGGRLNFSDSVQTSSGSGTLRDLINRQANNDLSHVTGLHVDPAQGTLYYKYSSPDEPNAGVAQRDSYYYSPSSGQRGLKDITFIPNPQFGGGQVTITYTSITETYQTNSGRILLNIEQSQEGIISLTATNRAPARFSGDAFNRACQQETGAALDYVVFSLPPASKGTLYFDYVSADNYGGLVSSGAMYRRKDLDGIAFVPAPGVTGDVTIYYTARPSGASAATYSGRVIIRVSRDDMAGSGGPVYNNVPLGGSVRFEDEDFQAYCERMLGDGRRLSYVQFDLLPSYDEGTLYYDYRTTGGGTPVTVRTSYYTGIRIPRLDRITFQADPEFTGSVHIPFTAWDEGGNRFSGQVEINVRSSDSSGTISYTCAPSQTRNFVNSDFTALCRDLTGRTLDYIRFEQLPASSDGTLYHNGSNRVSTSQRYYANSSNSYRISRLSFRAASGFAGTVEIPFVGYTANGSFDGMIVITSDGVSDWTIRYNTDSSTAAKFDREDFDGLSQWETDENVSTVRFEIPSTSQGDLYRNYRSSSSKGTRISSSSTTVSRSNLNQVAFVPAKNYTGTVRLDFWAKSTGGEEFRGILEIVVDRPDADVTVRYSTRTTPVDFQSSDFRRSGYTLSSIRFNAMPNESEGKLYYQYTSPTQYTRIADTKTSYRPSGSGNSLISDLTFVPRAGFSGTVTIPYTGTNSNKSTFDGEVVITVSPGSYSSRFTDLGGYTDQQRAAVEYIYENGITVGISSNEYGPELAITRGDFAVMVYKAFNFSPSGNSWVFNDVPPNAYYAQAVNTLYERGVVSGVGNGDYAPTANVAREDAMCMVQRAMRSVGWSASDGSYSSLSAYSDGSSVSGYAQGAMSMAIQRGYLPVSGRYLSPRQPLTRIDMAQILHRVLTA